MCEQAGMQETLACMLNSVLLSIAATEECSKDILSTPDVPTVQRAIVFCFRQEVACCPLSAAAAAMQVLC